MAKVNTAVKEKNINLNKVNVTGRLVADPETLTTKNDRFLHKLRIAINRTYKGKEMTSFIDVEMFSNEEIQLKKGQQVYVDGRVASDEWEKDGTFHHKTKIQAFNIMPTKMSGNDINKVFVSGRLVKDPIVVKVAENRSAIKFRLAVNRIYKQKGEKREWKQMTEFIDVVQFGTTDYIAQLASKIAKGKFVYIQGYLLQESWETALGEKRSKVVVVAEQINISVLKNSNNNNDETASSSSESTSSSEIEEELESLDEIDEIETPF